MKQGNKGSRDVKIDNYEVFMREISHFFYIMRQKKFVDEKYDLFTVKSPEPRQQFILRPGGLFCREETGLEY